MEVHITVNNNPIKAETDQAILLALHNNGIRIPTLCQLDGFTSTGACRMCVVEIKGEGKLKAACSTYVQEGMDIKTHSPKVIQARKKITELLLASHPDDCLYCQRNGNCELQSLAEELHIRERSFPSRASTKKRDLSGPGIIRDPSKCILCGRCVRICEETQACNTLEFAGRGDQTSIHTPFNQGINLSNCIHCGQCIMGCPTGALHEKSHLAGVLNALNNPEKTTVAQIDPGLTVSLSEIFSFKTGKDLNGLIVAALKKIGFDKVFDTAFATDIRIMEEAKILKDRIDHGSQFPLLSSDCPAWIKYAEQAMPNILEYISPCKSPQQITGTLLNRYWSEQNNIRPEDIYSVSIAPCTARKFEAQREEMSYRGVSAVDAVLTTREFIELINLNGIDMLKLEEEQSDAPFHSRSSAAKITAISGGGTEALIRALYFLYENDNIPSFKIKQLRGLKSHKAYTAIIGKHHINFAAVSGQHEARVLLDKILHKENKLHYIEVMACTHGCIGGGGQPTGSDPGSIKLRYKALYDMDSKESIKESYKNPGLIKLYKSYLQDTGSKKSTSLIYTSYSPRKVYL
ncbi:MAG: [Fe-Fe] hydrogenase large subunit C-terminal domain-containing protein [Bacteroidales bacterium]